MFEKTGDVRAVLDTYFATGAAPNVWYDWFCKDSQLEKRGKRLAQILAFFVAREKMDDKFLANKYVFFKNNCPCNGKLYDHVSICDKKTGNVLFCIEDQINEARGKGVWVYRASVGFNEADRELLPV
jgi:hypothetical protein